MEISRLSMFTDYSPIYVDITLGMNIILYKRQLCRLKAIYCFIAPIILMCTINLDLDVTHRCEYKKALDNKVILMIFG